MKKSEAERMAAACAKAFEVFASGPTKKAWDVFRAGWIAGQLFDREAALASGPEKELRPFGYFCECFSTRTGEVVTAQFVRGIPLSGPDRVVDFEWRSIPLYTREELPPGIAPGSREIPI